MHRLLCYFGWHVDGRVDNRDRTIHFDGKPLQFREFVFVCNRCGFEESYDTAGCPG